MRTASEILDEIRRLMAIGSDAALGELLGGVKQTTVASWRGRNSIPYDLIIAFCVKEELSIDGILTGDGDLIRQQPVAIGEPGAQYIQSGLSDPQIREMVGIMLDLDETVRTDLLRQARRELKLKRLEDVDQEKSELIDALEPRVAEQIKKLESITPEAAEGQKKRGTVTVRKRKKVLQ